MVEHVGVLDSIDFDAEIDEACKDLDMIPVSLERGSYVSDAISTGSLVFDLVIGGGFPPGRMTDIIGYPGDAKSTTLFGAGAQAAKLGIPADFHDPEGAADPHYMKRIGMDVDKLCGKRGKVKGSDGKTKDGWIEKPKLRYYQPDSGEQVFRMIRHVLKILPDKILQNGQWYYVFHPEKNKDGSPKKSGDPTKAKLEAGGVKFKKKGGLYWVEADDGGRAQRAIYIDSFAAMITETLEDDPDSKELALQARMFSKHIPTIKSKLAQKRVALIGTNQMRAKPMARYGPTEDEMCGWAIKFYADVRIRLQQLSGSTMGLTGEKEKGRIVTEPCWDGQGVDRYVYIKIQTLKNKFFSPFRTSYVRVWFEERGMPGRGIDPFWDTFQFLKETGQIRIAKNDSGKDIKGSYELSLKGYRHRFWTWQELKELVLNPDRYDVYKTFEFNDFAVEAVRDQMTKELLKEDPEQFKKLKDKAIKLSIPAVDIRGKCRHQMETDIAFEKYFKVAGEAQEDINEAFIEAELLEKTERADADICENCSHFKKKSCKEKSRDPNNVCEEFVRLGEDLNEKIEEGSEEQSAPEKPVTKTKAAKKGKKKK